MARDAKLWLLLGFDALSVERESGRLKLLVVQGLRSEELLSGCLLAVGISLWVIAQTTGRTILTALLWPTRVRAEAAKRMQVFNRRLRNHAKIVNKLEFLVPTVLMNRSMQRVAGKSGE